MNRSYRFLFSLSVLCTAGGYAVAQQLPPGVPASVVVTLEQRDKKPIPTVSQSDVSVKQGRDVRPVTEFTALPESSKTQLMLLIDDSARNSFNTELNTLKQFLNQLPKSYEVAVAYMRNGMAAETQTFTSDHAKAANSIRLALGPGGADVSPYDSLSDAAKKWPKTGADRKIMIMISSGIENLGGSFNSDNPYVNAGISDAQRAGIIVYSIYSPSVGHAGHSFWRSTWGQNFLSQLSDETGGESYILGWGSPVSFQPFLARVSEALKHQYRLSFLARAEKKSGLQPFNVSLKEKDANIAAPDKVYVRAGT